MSPVGFLDVGTGGRGMMEPRQTGMFRGSDSNEVRALFVGSERGKLVISLKGSGKVDQFQEKFACFFFGGMMIQRGMVNFDGFG